MSEVFGFFSCATIRIVSTYIEGYKLKITFSLWVHEEIWEVSDMGIKSEKRELLKKILLELYRTEVESEQDDK